MSPNALPTINSAPAGLTDPLLAHVDAALRAVSALADAARGGHGGMPPDAVVVAEPIDSSSSEPTLRLEEASELLLVSPSTLRRGADSGRIAMQRTSGGHRRFRMLDVERMRVALHGPGATLVLAAHPKGPVPAAANLLDVNADSIAGLAGRAVYQPTRTGWFAAPVAAEPIATWVALIGEAFAGGDYACADRATDRLMHSAERSGASLVERHVFLERFTEVLLRMLAERQAGADALRAVGRLFRHLAHRQLDAHSRAAAFSA